MSVHSPGTEPKRPTASPRMASAEGSLDQVGLLTVSETARLLCVSRRTVERLVSRGLLAFIALPLRRGGLRFRRGEIEEFLRQRHQAALG
jgi:excisionase family DNA binding protein